MTALAWTPLAFVLFVATLPAWRKLWTLTENLPERLGESNLPDIIRWSALPTLAAIGAVSYWGVALGGGTLAPGFPTVPAEAAGPPNAPIINLILGAGDSVTFRVEMSDFAPSQSDTHDSTRILVDSAGKDFTSPLVDSTTGPQTIDTISHAFLDGATYDFVALYRGTNGGWSDTSNVFQKTVSFKPGKITTLTVIGQTDSSLTFEWVTVHNGLGAVAFHDWRYKNITNDTASFAWGGAQEFANQFYDSLGTNIGDTVTFELVGLTSGDKYEAGILPYRGEPSVDAVYGAVPTSGDNTAIGTVIAGTPQDTTDTPNISASVVDSSNVNLSGSGFSGGNQSHDSTKWEISRYSGAFSTLIDSTSTAALTSVTVSANAVFKADTVYAARATYYGSSDASAVSDTVAFTMTDPAPPSEGHPNEPAGFTTLRTWTGTSLVPTGWSEIDPNSPHKHSKVDTAGLPSGNAAHYRHTYPEGSSADGKGTEYIATSATGWFPSTTERLYISYWLRPSANWVGHPTNVNKVLYVTVQKAAGSPDHNLFMLMQGTGSNFLNAAIEIQNIFWCAGGSSKRFVSSTKGFVRGQWSFVELLFTHNTVGNQDGAFKMWVDGTVALDESDPTDCHFEFTQHATTDHFISSNFNSIYGGRSTDPVPVTQTLDIDNIYISGGPR